MIPLAFAESNLDYTITKVRGEKNAIARLEALGFTPGSSLQVVSSSTGNVIVAIKKSRMAISREQALHIHLEESHEENTCRCQNRY